MAALSQDIVSKSPVVYTVADAATLTLNIDVYTEGHLTALAQALTIAAPTGTPVSGQSLVIRLKDNTTARALTWNAIFRAIGVILPTTTVAGKVTYVGFRYNGAAAKWDAIAVVTEA